jgi:hypothetical protein
MGVQYGANVVFPKQLMVAAVINVLRAGHTGNLADRTRVEMELQAPLEAGNYEGLGWNVFEGGNHLDSDKAYRDFSYRMLLRSPSSHL